MAVRGRVRRRTLMLLLTPVALAGGCTAAAGGPAPATSPRVTSASGTFGAWTAGTPAVTYDPAAVPEGANATLTIVQTATANRVRLTVAGLAADRAYGARLHTAPCGATGAAAGPQYQQRRDPAASAAHPSDDPAYVNAHNEVWLDLTTDGDGRGVFIAIHPWNFTVNPRSVVLRAGSAPVACLTLPA